MNFTPGNAKTLGRVGLVLLGITPAGCSGAPPRHVDEPATMQAAADTAEAVPASLVPLPASVSLTGDPFVLSPAARIYVTAGDDDAARVARYLADLIATSNGPRQIQSLAPGAARPGDISLTLDASLDSLGPEGYRLAITPAGVTVAAPRPAGLFYAVQTLRQLLPAQVEKREPLATQAVHGGVIVDRPRFAWRGAMLDVSRHFLKPADVKRYIDLMALYKLNRLHLHLADDQGWRIEIKSWPRLTAHGGSTAVGGGPGGFYTQAEYADLVDYARQRFITVIPEIDMPGHTNAALASYAELNCDGRARELYTGIRVGFSSLCPSKEITYKFVDDVIREISALTPGPWFHIGGDEVKTLNGRQYATFVERVQTIVQSHGKHMIGWDEIGPTKLLPTTIVQYWRPNAPVREAIRQGARFIMSPAHKVYLDMKYDSTTRLGLKWAGFVTVRTAYDWDPARLVAGMNESAILGIEAPLWSETVVTIADFEQLAFPRLTAVAEIGWSPRAARDWEGYRDRLAGHGPRLDALGVNYYKSPEIPWR